VAVSRLLPAFRLAVPSFGLTLVLAGAFGSYHIFVLHQFDPKFGDEWGNLAFGLQIMAVTAGVQAIGLFVLALLPPTDRFNLRGFPEVGAIVLFSILTHLVYPPAVKHVFLAAGAISLSAWLAALGLAAILNRRV